MLLENEKKKQLLTLYINFVSNWLVMCFWRLKQLSKLVNGFVLWPYLLALVIIDSGMSTRLKKNNNCMFKFVSP